MTTPAYDCGQTAKFPDTYCSQCGHSFGPGEHGYSHCDDHIRDASEDLLKVCDLLAASYDEQRGAYYLTDLHEARQQARAAILKARGES